LASDSDFKEYHCGSSGAGNGNGKHEGDGSSRQMLLLAEEEGDTVQLELTHEDHLVSSLPLLEHFRHLYALHKRAGNLPYNPESSTICLIVLTKVRGPK
jgi:hypothetical protein